MVKTIVIGALNTDIVASGIKSFPNSGQHAVAEDVSIKPGGKSRNIAEMAAKLSEDNTIAMIGITTKDKFGLWKPPYEALVNAGVDVSNITVAEEPESLPGLAFIAVNEQGENKIYASLGITKLLSIKHIDGADKLLKNVSENNGFIALTLELPANIANYGVKKANSLGIKLLLDPGGIQSPEDLDELVNEYIYLLKPNEHEAETLSGVVISDIESAQVGAERIFNKFNKLDNLLITHGVNGAYLFMKRASTGIHIPVPLDTPPSQTTDSTGAGDQTFAGIIAQLQAGSELKLACEFGVRVGTMQFYRKGIVPITKKEV